MNDHHNTPIEIVSVIRSVAEIGLDPCSNDGSVVNARVRYTWPAEDGLLLPWNLITPDEIVYVNPPYSSPNIPRFLSKAVVEFDQNRVQSCLLLPSDTGTNWFDHILRRCKEARGSYLSFVKGRIQFIGTGNSARFPSLLYWQVNKKEIASRVISLNQMCTTVEMKGNANER